MNSNDLQFVSALGQAVLMAILPVLAAVATRWVLEQVKAQAQKLSADQLKTMQWLAEIAVKAAEQAKLGGWVEDKKAYAINMCEAWLKSRGITIELDAIEAAIEAAVYEQFTKDKLLWEAHDAVTE